MSIAPEEGSEASSNPDVSSHRVFRCVVLPHVFPLVVAHHLERQFVVVPQEDAPSTPIGDLGRSIKNVDHDPGISPSQGEEEPWHQGEVIGHVEFVAIAEVLNDFLGPLVRFGKHQSVIELSVHHRSKTFQVGVRLRKVLSVGAITFIEVRDSVEA